MKKLLFLVAACLLVFNGFAQKAKPRKPAKLPKVVKAPVVVAKGPVLSTELDRHALMDGQAVAFDGAVGSLVATDPTTQNAQGQKRYLDRYPIALRQGDVLIVEYASEEFRAMLGLEKPDKQMVFSYDSLAFQGISVLRFRYQVPVSGTYTLQLTSAEALKTGEYQVRKFLLPNTSVFPAVSEEFCQKLTFLMAQSRLNFERLKGKKTKTDLKTGLVETYKGSYEITPGKGAEIVQDYDLNTLKYNTTLAEFTKKEDAQKALETYANQLKACTQGWQYQTFQGEGFTEFSSATASDYLTVTMRTLSKKKFAIVLGVD